MSELTEASPVRSEGLEINVMHDGVVIYQRDQKKIHYLNHTAGLVLEFCDGRHTPEELAKMVSEVCGLPEPPREDVLSCLQDLRSKDLIR